MADLYLKAREEGILTQAQIETAKKAEFRFITDEKE